MPTARQLLEEVDALMRRNRGAAEGETREPKGKDAAAINQAIDAAEQVEIDRLDSARESRDSGQTVMDPLPTSNLAAVQLPDSTVDTERLDAAGPEDIPLLTDVAGADSIHDASDSRVSASPERPPAPLPLDDVPLLTDAVDESDALSIMGVPGGAAEPRSFDIAPQDATDSADARSSRQISGSATQTPEGADDWLSSDESTPDVGNETPSKVAPESAGGEASFPQESAEPVVAWDANAPAPESVERPGQMPDAASEPATHGGVAVDPAPTTDERLHGDEAHWRALAEDIRMQVLQRIDIFTDAGLQTQLRERVQPIVDRASAELVNTINREVGRLVREYVAEAIEREIDKWRHDAL